MSGTRLAVIGGDRREVRIAERLVHDGHVVALYANNETLGAPVERAVSAAQAVHDAAWIVCPSPGLGDDDRIFAPNSDAVVHLNRDLLSQSAATAGGLVLGRATPNVVAAAQDLGIRLFEMKDDRSLAVANATAVAEGIICALIEATDRILAAHQILILGYGATGAALLDRLVALGCHVRVAARRPEALERIRQCGGAPVAFDQRLSALPQVDVVINTVPSVDSLPTDAFSQLQHHLVIDIASPPGGLDHPAGEAAGLAITWARGLAGGRAPVSAGDAQYEFLLRAMADVAAPETAAPSFAAAGEPLVPTLDAIAYHLKGSR